MSVGFYTHDFGPLPEHVGAVTRNDEHTVIVVDARMSPRERLGTLLELATDAELDDLGVPVPRVA